MRKYIKVGIGITLGRTFALVSLSFMVNMVMKLCAKDESFVEYAKEHEPKLYEKLNKYR